MISNRLSLIKRSLGKERKIYHYARHCENFFFHITSYSFRSHPLIQLKTLSFLWIRKPQAQRLQMLRLSKALEIRTHWAQTFLF